MLQAAQTLPVGFTPRNDDDETKTVNVLRETQSNAINYKASNAFALTIRVHDADYLFYIHDGKPFDDLNEILSKGCTPNVTGMEGAALQGAGLCASACAVHPKPLLLVGSTCGSKKFIFGSGYAKGNHWIIEDCTATWQSELERLVGPELNKYTVIYGFKFSYNGDSRLTPKMMNALALTMVGNSSLKFHFCEKEIGIIDPSSKKDYSTYERAKIGESGKKTHTGNIKRRAISSQGYFERFRDAPDLKDHGSAGVWTIPCNLFTVDIPDYNNAILPIEKARIVVNFFPNERKGQWMKNLREGNLDGNYSLGGSNEFGNAPYRKAYLYVPHLYSWAEKNEEKPIHYSRFNDNSVCSYKQHGRLINSMGLNYISGDDKGGPFIVVQIFLDQIGTAISPSVTLEATPQVLFGMFERRADFTFGAESIMHKIMKQAANAASPNVPDDLRNLCDKHFKGSTSDWIPLSLEGRKVHSSREKKVTIYDLDTGVVYDGTSQTGDKKRTLWLDQKGKPISASEIKAHHITRGVQFTDMTNIMSHFPQCQKNINKLEKELGL
jgi:hypothetical protein